MTCTLFQKSLSSFNSFETRATLFIETRSRFDTILNQTSLPNKTTESIIDFINVILTFNKQHIYFGLPQGPVPWHQSVPCLGIWIFFVSHVSPLSSPSSIDS